MHKKLIIITDRDGREQELAQIVVTRLEEIYAIVLRNVSNVKAVSASLWSICKEHKVLLLAHGDTANIKFCDGVHLNAKSQSIKQVRTQYDDELIIGYSAHSVEEAKAVLADGANYVFLSPVFRSKDNLLRPIGADAFNKAVEEIGSGVFALGGVDEENFKTLSPKASGFAGISCFFTKK